MNYSTDVTGRNHDKEPTLGNPQQKSWTILLERKIRESLTKNGRGSVPVTKVQQPINGQWMVVVNDTILVHQPAKTALSVYRAESPVNAETIPTMILKNLVSDTNMSARVKNQTEMLRLVLIEVDRDLGLLKEEPEKAKIVELECEIDAELNGKPEVTQVLPKGKRSRIQRRGKSATDFRREPVVAQPGDDAEVVVESKPRQPLARQKPEQKMFGPLIELIKTVEPFKRLGCMLVDAVDNANNSVSWAVNVYVPVHELVNGEHVVVEHLHLLTVIDEFSRSLAESDLNPSTIGPLTLQLDEDEMRGNVAESLENYFYRQTIANQGLVTHEHLAITQEEIGQDQTSMLIFACMAGMIQRQSVQIHQMCKHPVPAVSAMLVRQYLKTVYFGKAIKLT